MSEDLAAATFVIIGTGHAGSQAATTLRIEGFAGEIIMIGAEKWRPYERPPLSKSFLAVDAPIEKTYFKKLEFYDEKRITLRLDAKVATLDRAQKQLVFVNGETLHYDKLLIATGSRPRRLKVPGGDLPGVFNLSTIDESLSVRNKMVPGSRVVVVGGGYIGLEVAAAAVKSGASTTVLEATSRVLGRVAAEPISHFFQAEHRAQGVDLRVNAKVAALEGHDHVEAVVLDDGTRIPADVVIVGVGVEAADELARAAGLPCDNGIWVDEHGRTEDPDIFAAGDVTHHYDPRSDSRRRLECVQNAMGQAQSAARAMLGIERPHADVPTFWSDQYDLKLQIVGLGSPSDEIVLRGDPASRKFSALHLLDGKLVAVEAVSSVKDFVQGKQLITAGAMIDRALATDPAIALSASAIKNEETPAA